jgi:hypothetical protein
MSSSAVNNNSTHYLHRVDTAFDRRKWYRRPTNLLVRIIYMNRGIRQIDVRTCKMTDLSEGGARLEIALGATLPGSFFIVIGDHDIYIGAIVVNRNEDIFNVQFITLQSARLVNKLSRIKDPMAGLVSLGDVLDA